MPLQRRLPKRGFKSLSSPFKAEVTLSELNSLPVSEVDILVLKQFGVISDIVRHVRVILSGSIKNKILLKDIAITKGALLAIEAVGGSVVHS